MSVGFEALRLYEHELTGEQWLHGVKDSGEEINAPLYCDRLLNQCGHLFGPLNCETDTALTQELWRYFANMRPQGERSPIAGFLRHVAWRMQTNNQVIVCIPRVRPWTGFGALDDALVEALKDWITRTAVEVRARKEQFCLVLYVRDAVGVEHRVPIATLQPGALARPLKAFVGQSLETWCDEVSPGWADRLGFRRRSRGSRPRAAGTSLRVRDAVLPHVAVACRRVVRAATFDELLITE